MADRYLIETSAVDGYLQEDGSGVLLLEQLPGYVSVLGALGSANTTSTPDHADFAITGDIDVRALLAADDWTPAAPGGELIISQRSGTANRGWWFYVNQPDGVLAFGWSSTGSSPIAALSTVAPVVADGGLLWVRATLNVDNGASGKAVKFYTSNQSVETDPAAIVWTQLGTTVTSAGVTSIFDSTANVEIGTDDAFFGLHGKVYYAEIRNGIGGTIVANPDFRFRCADTTTTLTDDYTRVWTVNGSSSWVNSVLCSVAANPPYRNPMPPLIVQ